MINKKIEIILDFLKRDGTVFITDIEDIRRYIYKLERAVKRLEFQDNANEMVHDYDVNMIDKVKGENVEQYKKIKELETKVKELGKGQHTLMQSRRKWKNKYYKERRKRKEANKSVRQIYLDYQDIGNMYFNLDSKVQPLVEKLKEQSSRKISNGEDKGYTEGYRDLARDLLEMLEVAND